MTVVNSELREEINNITAQLYNYIDGIQTHYMTYEDPDGNFGKAMESINSYRRLGTLSISACADFIYVIQRFERMPFCKLESVYYEVCTLFMVEGTIEDLDYIRENLIHNK